MRAFAILFLIVNVVLFIAALHNMIIYLCRLKITKSLILAFYGLLCVESFYNSITMTLILMYPPNEYETNFFEDFRWQSVILRTSIVLSMAFGLVVFLTLQQLGLSIQLLYEDIGENWARCV